MIQSQTILQDCIFLLQRYTLLARQRVYSAELKAFYVVPLGSSTDEIMKYVLALMFQREIHVYYQTSSSGVYEFNCTPPFEKMKVQT